MNISFWVSYVGLWLLVAGQGFAFLELVRQIGVLRRQLGPQQGAGIISNAVATGERVPDLVGVRADTLEPTSWDSYFDGAIGVVVFLTSSCVTCREIAEDLSGLAKEIPEAIKITTILEAQVEEGRTFLEATHLDPRAVVFDEHGETSRRIGVSWKPAALTLRDGRLGHAAIVNTVYQVEALVMEELGHAGTVEKPVGPGPIEASPAGLSP